MTILRDDFGIGVKEGVYVAAMEHMRALCERIPGCSETKRVLVDSFHDAVVACEEMFLESMSKALVPVVPESRIFWKNLCEALISEESWLSGTGHLAAAKNHLDNQGNVLIVQNHVSGFDILATWELMRRHFGSCSLTEFILMSGHVLNLYLIPLSIFAGVERAQIFSRKYKSMSKEIGLSLGEMSRRNTAVRAGLQKRGEKGGVCVLLYPEAGRGDNGLLYGEPRTTKIPAAIGGNLMILPTYVEDIEAILPQDRCEVEFNRFLINAQAGICGMRCGKPIMWREIAPKSIGCDQERRNAHALIMRSIANLAPTEDMKGEWKEM